LLSRVAHDPDTPPAVATDLEPLVFQRVSVAKFLVLRRATQGATRRATQKPIPSGRFDAAPHVAANEVFPIHCSPLIGTLRRAGTPRDETSIGAMGTKPKVGYGDDRPTKICATATATELIP
jgi:hypothetical protein